MKLTHQLLILNSQTPADNNRMHRSRTRWLFNLFAFPSAAR